MKFSFWRFKEKKRNEKKQQKQLNEKQQNNSKKGATFNASNQS